jgi:hypothetical protein
MKIFGLGLSRTGTGTLTEALKLLGFTSSHYPPLRNGLDLPEHIQGFFDIPIIPIYKQLDVKYPNSKFIFSSRDINTWLRSCEYYFGNKPSSKMSGTIKKHRRLVYGSEDFDRELFSLAYLRHEVDVLKYFENRPNDLLIIDICSGEGWTKLCPFLNVSIPDVDFPHKHKSKYIKAS